MKENKEKKIDKIGFIIILITIILLNIFIGSNIKQPIWIMQVIVSVFTLIYLVIKKVQKEQKLIIKGKIDIVVLLFMISTMIPLLLGKQVSLEGTINFILKYWSVYGFYILVRNIVTDNKQIKIIINTLIISSIIPIIFGYDKILKLNIFEPFLDFINAVNIEDLRMISTFGYANTYAAYLGLITSLAIAQFLNTKSKKIKILYAIYILIASITILLTQSKFVLALLAFIIFLFIIKGIKDKKITKKWIIAGIIAIIAFFIYFFIAIQISKPLEITEEEHTCVIRGIESNTKYKFEFNIDAVTDKTYDVFKINIVEITRYFSEKTIGTLSFAEFSGNKAIDIETNEDIDHIEIRIDNPLNQKITINDFKINDEKYILEYKIILDEVVRVFTTFNFKNSSVWQRVDYWKDGVEIIKDHWLFGAGGNTWRTLYGQKQDYLYYAKEGHCYILEVWMSFGVLGILSYIFIIAIFIQNGYELLKNNKDNKETYRNLFAIIIGISIIIIHSLMDFDMSYLIIEMMFYMIMAIISKEDKNIQKNTNILEIIITVIFVIISIGNILGFTAQILEDETGVTSNKIAPWISRYHYNKIVYIENNKIQDDNKIKYIKKYIQNEPYQYQNVMYEIMCNQIIKNINKDNIEQEIENIKYLIGIWKTIPKERKYEVEPIQKRGEILLDFTKNLIDVNEDSQNDELQSLVKEILELIQTEYKENVSAILDYRRNHFTETMVKFKYEYYTDTYNEATELLQNM